MKELPNENKVELTPFEFASHWWVKRMKDFVADIIAEGYIEDEELEFAQFFEPFTDYYWAFLFLRLAPMIEREYNKEGKFDQTTINIDNDRYIGHGKINEMLKSIFKKDMPNPCFNPTGCNTRRISLLDLKHEGRPQVYLTGYNTTFADDYVITCNLTVDKDPILSEAIDIIAKLTPPTK